MLASRLIRVLVVDDSALVRQMLTRALSMDPRIEIVGTARTGVEAIERARELQPDVITLDIEMPELTGLEALPYIRKHTNSRVVILSSLDDPDTTYRALSMGAIDFIAKPHGGVASSITELSEQLLKVIKTANRITPDQANAVFEGHAEGEGESSDDGSGGSAETGGKVQTCVAIASSTGGPPALERVFTGLQASMPAAYLVVQHLPPGFSGSLARRLDAVSDIRVVEAQDGMHIRPGVAYIAPHGRHLVVSGDRSKKHLRFSDDPPLHGVRPAGDLLMRSVAEHYGENSVGVVLTGMGSDGARGALQIRIAGGDTVVQDERTSVVWGMPNAALQAGAATRMVPVGLVAAEIRRAVRSRTPGGGA